MKLAELIGMTQQMGVTGHSQHKPTPNVPPLFLIVQDFRSFGTSHLTQTNVLSQPYF